MSFEDRIPTGRGAVQIARAIKTMIERHNKANFVGFEFATAISSDIIQLDRDGYQIYSAEGDFLTLEHVQFEAKDRLIVTTIGGRKGPVLVLGRWQKSTLVAVERQYHHILVGKKQPPQEAYISAESMVSPTTDGAASTTTQGTNHTYRTKDFSDTVKQHSDFHFAVPAEYDGGDITVRAIWTADAGVVDDGVAWEINILSVSNDEDFDAAKTDIGSIVDKFIAIGDLHQESLIWSSTKPMAGDIVFVRVSRDVDDAADDLAELARLISLGFSFPVREKEVSTSRTSDPPDPGTSVKVIERIQLSRDWLFPQSRIRVVGKVVDSDDPNGTMTFEVVDDTNGVIATQAILHNVPFDIPIAWSDISADDFNFLEFRVRYTDSILGIATISECAFLIGDP